jgi:hypothetical protein
VDDSFLTFLGRYYCSTWEQTRKSSREGGREDVRLVRGEEHLEDHAWPLGEERAAEDKTMTYRLAVPMGFLFGSCFGRRCGTGEPEPLTSNRIIQDGSGEDPGSGVGPSLYRSSPRPTLYLTAARRKEKDVVERTSLFFCLLRTHAGDP